MPLCGQRKGVGGRRRVHAALTERIERVAGLLLTFPGEHSGLQDPHQAAIARRWRRLPRAAVQISRLTEHGSGGLWMAVEQRLLRGAVALDRRQHQPTVVFGLRAHARE